MRVFAAFLLACVTAIPVGIAMGVSRIARGIFDPPIEFYRPLPPLAYLPLIVIWFGIEETAKVMLIYLACFAPLAMAARAGVRACRIEQINAAYSMGASKWQVIWHVVIPAAMPEILTGMRIAIGFGWTTLVAAEMVAATVGPGPDGAERVELPAHRRRDHGHRRDRRRRLPVRPADALRRAAGRALEGQGLNPPWPPLALKLFPFLSWRDRVTRDTLRADLLAGLIGALVVLPQGVAFATLAGLPPQFGLYCAMLPAIVAALWGSSWHQVSGPTNAIVARRVRDDGAAGGAGHRRLHRARADARAAGRPDAVRAWASRAWARSSTSSRTRWSIGFTAGAGLLIIAAQLRNFFGVPIPSGARFFETLDAFARGIARPRPVDHGDRRRDARRRARREAIRCRGCRTWSSR